MVERHPFTTEDFRYYWEDVASNKGLSPPARRQMLVEGEAPERRSSTKRPSTTAGQAEPAIPAGLAGPGRSTSSTEPLSEAVSRQIRDPQEMENVDKKQLA
jgi:hypothetical protein